jgi:hypothetical protein
MIEKNIKNLEMKVVGVLDWKKLRDFLLIQFQEAKTEEEFNFIMESIVGSLFSNIKELDKTRKALNIQLLSKKEKDKIKNRSKK